MNETPNIINVNGENYVKMSSIPVAQPQAVNTDGMKFVICRGYYCGVHAGWLKAHDGNHCTLVNSRRLWAWKAMQGISLSAVAKHGVDASCEFPNALDEIWLGDVYEVIPCSAAATKSIMEAKVREQD